MTSLASFCHLQADCALVPEGVDSPWLVPAEAIRAAIALQNWTVVTGPLPPDCLCVCDAWNQRLVVAKDFADYLICPHRHQEVLSWILATELVLARYIMTSLTNWAAPSGILGNKAIGLVL